MPEKRRAFSIKWKLSLSLIATGLSLVLVYVIIATKVFESDKISYVFDAQNAGLHSLKREMDNRIEQAVLSAKTLLATVDSTGHMSPAATDLFKDSKSLLAIELWDESNHKSLFRIEKTPGTLSPPGNANEKATPGQIQLLPQPDQNFLLVLNTHPTENSLLLARVLIDAHDFLPKGDVSQPLILAQNEDLLATVGTVKLNSALINELVKDFGQGLERTMLWDYQGQNFLVSSTSLAMGHLKLIALTPQQEALGALKTLLYRSLIFLAFSTFGLIIVSLLLAKSLTANLQILTLAAREVGKGNFEQTPAIRSEDEMGVLAKALIKMSQEIKRLLEETRDKARMEAELKTAKLVQESLYPTQSSATFSNIEIHGLTVSSTECGGDWWYYFTQNEFLYVAIADATGHGTPAALITAAARSVFSRIETEKISLPEMMRAWDFAVSSCSQKQVFMTGMLLRVNCQTGMVHYLSAGHEPPYLFTQVQEGFADQFISLDKHPVLGEDLSRTELMEQALQLDENASLVLFTDGLFSVETADGKKLSERRFGKAIAQKLEYVRSADAITNLVLQTFEEHRQNIPLPDDVTLVTLRRKGPVRNVQLASDSGDVVEL